MCEILEIPFDEEWYEDGIPDELIKELNGWYKELETVLGIFLRAAHIEPGTYEAHKYGSNWKKVD